MKERGKRGGGKDEEGSTSTNDCDYMILCMMLLFMLIKSMLLQKLLWLVRFHPLMLQIVASPGAAKHCILEQGARVANVSGGGESR